MAVRCSLVHACILFSFVDFYLVDDLFSVFLMKSRRQLFVIVIITPHSSPIQSLEVHFEGAASKILRRDDALHKIVWYHPVVVVVLHSFSLCVSLSLWRVRPRNVRCLPEENKRWLTLLFFSLQSIMNSDDGNVIDDQQHRRCCCFLGEVVLQKKSSKCNDE